MKKGTWMGRYPAVLIRSFYVDEVTKWCKETGCGELTSEEGVIRFEDENEYAFFLLKWS